MSDGLYLDAAVQHQRDRAYGCVQDFLQPRTTAIFLVLLSALAIAMAFLHSNTYTRKLELTGQIDDRHIARVSSQIDGRVISLYVTEGEHVEKDALLGVISGDTTDARQEQLDELEKQHTQLALNRKSHFLLNDLALERLETRLSAIEDQVERQSSLLGLHRQTVGNFQRQYKAASALKESGYFTEQNWIQLQQEDLTHEQQGLELLQQMSTLVHERNDVKRSIEEIKIKFEQELLQLDGRLSALRQSRLRLIENDRKRIKAPVSGTVTITNIKPGAEVARGDLLISIEPKMTINTATLLAPSHSHRFLKSGNPVRLRVQNLTEDQLGYIDGKITHISDHPVLFNDGYNNSAAMFIVRIALDSTHFKIKDQRFPLKSGMSLTCTVDLETHSLLDWILHPIRYWYRVVSRLPMIFQADTNECALACYAMLLGFHGYPGNLASLRSRFMAKSGVVSVAETIDVGNTLGFSCRALRCEVPELKRVVLPAIVHWDFDHYVVLKSVNHRTVTLHDPAVGERHLSKKSFAQHFTGIVLEVTPDSMSMSADLPETRARSFDYIGARKGLAPAIVQLLILTLLLQLFTLGMPLFMQLVVDEVLLPNDVDLLTVLVLGFTGLALITLVTRALQELTGLYLASRLSIQMAGRLYSHLIRLKTDFFRTRYMGDIVSRFQSFSALQDFISSSLVNLLLNSVLIITTLIRHGLVR